MKKNNLIVEVDRIKEMMNLTILNEGIPDPIIKGMMKVVDDFALANKGSLTKNFEPALKRVQDAFNSGNIPQFKKSFYRLIDMDDELYDLLKSDIFKQNQKLIDSINKSIEDSLSRRPPLTKDEVKTKLNDYWRDQIFPNYPSRKFRDELMTQFNRKIDTFKRQIPTTVNQPGTIKKFFSSLGGKELQTIRRIVFRYVKKHQSLVDEFLKLSDEAEAIMNKQPPGDASYQFKKMVDVLASMKKTANTDAQLLYEGLSGDAKKGLKDSLGEDVIKQLESGQKPWSELLTMLRSGDTEINQRLINRDGKLFSIASLQKLGRYLAWGDTRSLKEIQEFIVKKGFTNYLGRRASSYFLFWPILKGFAFTTWFAALSKIEGLAEDLGFEDFNPVDYNESVSWTEIFKDQLRQQFNILDIPQFLIPTYIDEFLLGMVDFWKGKNVESEDFEEEVENEVERQRIKVWNGFSKKEQEVMTDAAEETGNPDLIDVTNGDGGETSTETQTTEEEPLTYDPVFKNLFSKYPCLTTQFKNGDIKKLSDTKLKIMGNGSEWTVIIGSDGNASYTEKNGVRINPVPVQCG